jgi:hypothetical protein
VPSQKEREEEDEEEEQEDDRRITEKCLALTLTPINLEGLILGE